MRCFNIEGTKINRGIYFKGADGIDVGDMRVGFADSLLNAPACHFGQHIVNCGVEKDVSGLKLTAGNEPSEQPQNSVLLRITNFLPDGEAPTVSTTGGVNLHTAMTWEHFVGSIASNLDGCDYYWSALVELEAGASLTLTTEREYAVVENLWQLLRLAPRTVSKFGEVLTYSYDGQHVTVQRGRRVDDEEGPTLIRQA